MKIVVLLAALSLSACSSLEGAEKGLALLEKAAEGAEKVEDATLGNAMKALPKYCKVPMPARMAFRARVNARPEAEGAQIMVICPGDT